MDKSRIEFVFEFKLIFSLIIFLINEIIKKIFSRIRKERMSSKLTFVCKNYAIL